MCIRDRPAGPNDRGMSMRELRLVAVSDDGSHLVVRSNEPDGEQFRLPLDERLRAAVRRDVPRLSQLEIRRESSLTPREIQARLRAGESPEDVAHAAGVPVERVTRFEGPVLAERQRRVEEARAATPHLSLIHISEPTRLGMISYAVFCLKTKNSQVRYWSKGPCHSICMPYASSIPKQG